MNCMRLPKSNLAQTAEDQTYASTKAHEKKIPLFFICKGNVWNHQFLVITLDVSKPLLWGSLNSCRVILWCWEMLYGSGPVGRLILFLEEDEGCGNIAGWDSRGLRAGRGMFGRALERSCAAVMLSEMPQHGPHGDKSLLRCYMHTLLYTDLDVITICTRSRPIKATR